MSTESLPIAYGRSVCTGRLVQIENTTTPALTIGAHDFEMDLSKLESPTLARLIEEVRIEQTTPRVYDRWHNRHNRSR